MERMPRKRSRSRVAAFASLNVLLSLLVQFAPTLHALTPHEEHSSSCTHSSQSLHVEAASPEEAPPCLVCAQVLGRAAVAGPSRVEFNVDVKTIAFSPIVRAAPRGFVPILPDPRGPPPAA